MAWPLLTLSRTALGALKLCLIILQVMSSVLATVMVIDASLFLISEADYINLVYSRGGYLWPAMLILIGIIYIPINIFGVYAILQIQLFKYARRTITKLHIYVIMTLILAIITVPLPIIGHILQINGASENDIVYLMKRYANDISAKLMIDSMQINFECCGSKSYTEWFSISWIDPEFGGAAPKRGGSYFSDDVPFSCCAGGSLGPCIHHAMMATHSIYHNNKPGQVSVSPNGCYEKILKSSRHMMATVTHFLMTQFLMQIILCIGGRVLYTALKTRRSAQDEGLEFTGWIFGNHKVKHRYVPVDKDDDKCVGASCRRARTNYPTSFSSAAQDSSSVEAEQTSQD